MQRILSEISWMPKSQNDKDVLLVNRIKEGDRMAFRELVDQYKDVSLSLVDSILKDRTKSEDVLQDVFIKVFEAIDSFKFRSKFSTWLFRIVVNTSFNALKKDKKSLNLDASYDRLIDSSAIGVDAIKSKDQKKYIILAMARLRADEALVLRLFYLCELSIKEIEEVTSYKRAKIKVDLHRGRDNMYFHLKQMLGDEINQLL